MSCHARLLAVLGTALAGLYAVAPVHAQDDDEPEYRPGLSARYAAPPASCTRLDADVAFDWRKGSPDPRLPAGPFTAAWSGRLFTIVPGEYRMQAFAAGKVKIQLAGQTVLEARAEKPGWLAAKSVELEYGHHPLTVEFERTGEEARLALFWEGPKFQLEPIPPRHLFHDPKQTPPGEFERGQLLTRALRCAACHEIPGQPPAISAPSLASAGRNLDAAWLVEWLASKPDPTDAGKSGEMGRRMPHLGLARDEAEALAAYLTADAEKPRELKIEPDPAPANPKDSDKKKDDEKAKKSKPSIELGATLLRTVGCLACHQASGLGAGGLFGGGDLGQIAAKRPADYFAGWLADPSAFNTAHRMPVFRLSSVERESLGLYLATLGKPGKSKPEKPTKPDKPTDATLERGRRLAMEHRCAACHALPGGRERNEGLVKRTPLPAAPAWDASCLAEAAPAKRRPGYALAADVASPIQLYLTTVLAPARPSAPVEQASGDGAFVLAERQCLSCHARDPAGGIAPQLARVVAADPELAAQLPALAPPALNGIGDKLHEEWLLSAIESKQPLRPWLRIRMPRFALDAREKAALVDYFVAHDRIPERPVASTAPPAEPAMKIAGSRLVTADGFGCTSCHQVGSSIPHQVALNAHGTDLSLIGKRIRRPWYDRWVRDPARIVPRMEMPSVKLPVRGVLDDNLDQQLAAVWHVVNQPGFEPPLPNPIRTVRSSGLPEETRATAIADVVIDGKKAWLKPLVVGLPNRHNLLFDFERGSLAGWWIGDSARQRTRGKSWLWEPGGQHIWPLVAREGELRIEREGRMLAPRRVGQFEAGLDDFEHVPGGLAAAYRLQFSEKPGEEVRVRQTWTALDKSAQQGEYTGFRRALVLTGLPAHARVEFRVAPRGPYAPAADDWYRDDKNPGKPQFHVVGPATAKLAPGDADHEPALTLVADQAGEARAEIDYRTSLPVDRYLPVEVPSKPRTLLPLDVVPGYRAVELPLADPVMPTGLAWMADGTLAVSSLKGEVWLARDRDNDGTPDTWQLFSDNLATPYGLVVPPQTQGVIDVIAKSALVRLTDSDGDGHADRTHVLADGWGHTEDYHDWAVGLVARDGDYYIALPCEQDNRSPEAAQWRGKLLRLSPRDLAQPTAERWSVREICGGLRFPMGLAMNRAGDLFASDNQGNYNPFNELNHLLPGKRYGFINSLEKKAGLAPPLEEPAVNIPHPWTRSVNGICFLETPRQAGRADQPMFGPFEGHLLGCEYDTQRLIRISLDRVGDSYQGAAYPFSRDPAPGKRGLEGPVVCAVSPAGDLVVGNMRDSGWGAGANVGSVVRLRPDGPLPWGIAEVRAWPSGLTVHFTRPVDPKKAGEASHYAVEAYRRVSTPAYGGPDVDRHPVKVVAVQVDPEGRQAALRLDPFDAGLVYELRVKNLAPDSGEFFPAEAHYTLRRKPQGAESNATSK